MSEVHTLNAFLLPAAEQREGALHFIEKETMTYHEKSINKTNSQRI